MFEFNSTAYNEFIRNFSNDSINKLIVYAGDFDENRKYAIEQLKREIIGEIVEIDLNDIITPFEDESYAKIDSVVSSISEKAVLVIFRNAGMLSGVYTGFTYSVVKYATPQEKYFLNAIKELDSNLLLEFDNVDQLDEMVKRVSDVIVTFKAPSSLIEKIVWWARSIRVNGSNLPSPRPRTLT